MSIRLPFAFTNPNLKPASLMSASLLAKSSLAAWYQADASCCTVSGSSITRFADKKGGAEGFVPAAGKNPATMVSGAIGAYSAASFDGTDNIYTMENNFPLTPNGAISLAVVINATNAGRTSFVLSYPPSTGYKFVLDANPVAGNVGLLASNGQITASMTPGNWHLVVASCTGTTAKLRVDGVTATPVSIPSTSYGAANWTLGAQTPTDTSYLFVGLLSDVWLFTGDIFADTATLALLERFVTNANVYNLPFTPLVG